MSDDRWGKLEEIVRRVVREEITASKKKAKTDRREWTGEFDSKHIQAWQIAFPAVDIEAEIKQMTAWVVANPVEAPHSNFAGFAHRWLAKAQNRLSLRSIPAGRNTTVAPPSLCAYCLKHSVGAVNGIRYCNEHSTDAMDMKPRPKMPGVVAKAVAGND